MTGESTPPTKSKSSNLNTAGFSTPSAHSRKVDPFKVSILSKFAKNGVVNEDPEEHETHSPELKKNKTDVTKAKNALMNNLRDNTQP